MCCHCEPESEPTARKRRRFHPIRFLFHLLLTYVLLSFGGGTLIQSGHPVAIETGRLIHTVLFIEPTIRMAYVHDQHMLAGGLRMISHGVDVHHLL